MNSKARKSSWVELNVGGTIFKTTRTTLCRIPESMFTRLLNDDRKPSRGDRTGEESIESTSAGCRVEWQSDLDQSGAYLIDRSSKYFEPILNYMRHGKLIMEPNISTEGVFEEAKFYGLIELAEQLEEMMALDKAAGDKAPSFPRSAITKILAQTPYNQMNQLRFQGLDFSNQDLSNLDLRNINFKFSNLSGANLSNATLSQCTFEWANLKSAVLDGAQLLGVKMTRANLESASLKNCNFEDPHQTTAVLEGANLKNARVENSQMSGINLRVASLKNASLRNCDLKSACLAGADLENCDLSGSDLGEANLRGANFTNATFDDMVTPLHMSQTLP